MGSLNPMLQSGSYLVPCVGSVVPVVVVCCVAVVVVGVPVAAVVPVLG